MRYLFAVVRTVMAVAILAATGVTLGSSVAFWTESGFRDTTTLMVNFFSYFTIESNIAAAVVLVIGAVLLVLRRADDPRWYTVLRAAVVAYMAITGLVYNLLLRGLPVTAGGESPPWTNEVMHLIAPIYLVLDWLLAPGRTPLPWKHIATVLAFPIVWVFYTMVRGPLVFDQVKEVQTWYPYPFLNPASFDSGYGTVWIYIVLIAVAFGIVGTAVIWVSRRWPRAVADGAAAGQNSAAPLSDAR